MKAPNCHHPLQQLYFWHSICPSSTWVQSPSFKEKSAIWKLNRQDEHPMRQRQESKHPCIVLAPWLKLLSQRHAGSNPVADITGWRTQLPSPELLKDEHSITWWASAKNQACQCKLVTIPPSGKCQHRASFFPDFTSSQKCCGRQNGGGCVLWLTLSGLTLHKAPTAQKKACLAAPAHMLVPHFFSCCLSRTTVTSPCYHASCLVELAPHNNGRWVSRMGDDFCAHQLINVVLTKNAIHMPHFQLYQR